MKFKDWKKEVKKIDFEIPDIYNKIKPFVEKRDIMDSPSTFSSFNRISLKKFNYSLMPVIILAFFILVFFVSLGINSLSDSLNGDASLKRFDNTEQISSLLQANRQSKESYLNEHKETPFIPIIPLIKEGIFGKNVDSFEATEVAKVPDLSYSRILTEAVESPDILKTDENRIYYVANNSINVLELNDTGELKYLSEIKYTELVSTSIMPTKNALYITDKCIILIFTMSYETNVIIYDKVTYDKLYSYKLKGNYCDSYLNSNNLYLINTYNISNYLDSNLEVPLPTITENNVDKDIKISDIRYLKSFVGETYTIISTISLSSTIKSTESIILSYDKWDYIYPSETSIYLINTESNFNNELEYGDYTSFFKFSYNGNKLAYSGSFKFKGSVLKNSFYELDKKLVVATSVNNYEVTKSPLLTTIVPTNTSSKLLVFDGGSKLNLSSTKIISDNFAINDLHFEDNKLIICFSQANTSYSEINLENLIVTELEKANPHPVSINSFGISSAFSLTSNDDYNLMYLLRFIDEETSISWANGSYPIFRTDYAPFIEALYNQEALFYKEIDSLHYFGFSIRNSTKTKGTYQLYVADEINKTVMIHEFQDNSRVFNRLAHINLGKDYFILISDNLVRVYDSDFIKINELAIPVKK